jgi:uncharacterized protein (DUF433 family)
VQIDNGLPFDQGSAANTVIAGHEVLDRDAGTQPLKRRGDATSAFENVRCHDRDRIVLRPSRFVGTGRHPCSLERQQDGATASYRIDLVIQRVEAKRGARAGCSRTLSATQEVRVAFERITVRADQMDGAPCIRGLRIPVATVVGMVADGMTVDEILAAYPDLEAADVEEALRYAAEAVRERELPLAAG